MNEQELLKLSDEDLCKKIMVADAEQVKKWGEFKGVVDRVVVISENTPQEVRTQWRKDVIPGDN